MHVRMAAYSLANTGAIECRRHYEHPRCYPLLAFSEKAQRQTAETCGASLHVAGAVTSTRH